MKIGKTRILRDPDVIRKTKCHDLNYGVRQAGNTRIIKCMPSKSPKPLTFQISKPTVEHNLDDIASNGTKMRLEIIF